MIASTCGTCFAKQPISGVRPDNVTSIWGLGMNGAGTAGRTVQGHQAVVQALLAAECRASWLWCQPSGLSVSPSSIVHLPPNHMQPWLEKLLAPG